MIWYINFLTPCTFEKENSTWLHHRIPNLLLYVSGQWVAPVLITLRSTERSNLVLNNNAHLLRIYCHTGKTTIKYLPTLVENQIFCGFCNLILVFGVILSKVFLIPFGVWSSKDPLCLARCQVCQNALEMRHIINCRYSFVCKFDKVLECILEIEHFLDLSWC